MERVVYEEISRLDAMAIIDSGNTENLYFIGIYKTREHGSCFTPRGTKQTVPIKYLSKMILRNSNVFFNKYDLVFANPENYLIENHLIQKITHKWMIKKEELDIRHKPPIIKK